MTSPISKTASTASPGLMLRQPVASVLCADARIARLIDEHRELVALAAGKQIEICMALGDRDGAQRARKEMEANAGARRAVREAGCYFLDAGARDSLAIQGRVAA